MAGGHLYTGARTGGRWAIAVVLAVLVGVVSPVPVGPGPVVASAQSGCAAPAGTTGVTGTVTDAVSTAALPGALVAVLRTSDQRVAAGAVAGGDGRFTATVPPGSYFLYVVAPSDRHVAALHPGTVTVTAQALSTANPVLAPTRGSVAGSVTDEADAGPLPGSWVVAVDLATGAPALGAVADGSGRFRIDGLRVGPHLVATIDPTGRRWSEFSGGVQSPVDATPVAVAAGEERDASAALSTRPAPPATSWIDGTVAEAGGGLLAGRMVVALRAADLSFVAGSLTDAAGRYRVELPVGGFKLAVVDPTGSHAMTWFDGRPFDGLAGATTVTAPGTVDPILDRSTGAVAGVVRDDPTGAPLPCVWVVAIAPEGGIAGTAVTGGDGRYQIEGLRPGTYRLTMVDPTGGRAQEYWEDSATYAGSTPVTVGSGAVAVADGDLTSSTPFGAPTQWVARQFTELLGRPPSPSEWKLWTDHYGAQTACTAASLNVLPLYLTGLTTPPVPGLAPGPATEFASLYPDATPLDRALRAAALVRAAYGHDPNDNDWNTRIKPYAQGTATWSATVTSVYTFVMGLAGPGTFCDLNSPNYAFGFTRAIDLRAHVTALTPAEPLAPSSSQTQLEARLASAAQGATVSERTVILRPGEVVRVGGAANGNRPLVVPAGVTLTSEGVDATFTEPVDGHMRSLPYARMGRIVPATSPGTPGSSPADGSVCEGQRCNNLGLVSLGAGAHLAGVWVDGMGLSDTNYKVALVRTAGSAADSPVTPYDDRTSVVASRLSEPTRDGVGLRLEGASTGTPCVGQRVLGNLVTGYSSRHQFDRRGQAQWVDGIVVSCEDATVVGNAVVDVTDIGIVVNGSIDRQNAMTPQRSVVRANAVLSAGHDAHVALGADAMGQCLPVVVPGTAPPQPPVPCLDLTTPRDFTGASIEDNTFFTGSRTSFDIGLMVGGGAIWGDHRISNLLPGATNPGARGVSVTGNTTAGLTTRVNIGIDVRDMHHATVTANAVSFRVVDGNPRVTWGRCPQASLLVGSAESTSLSSDFSFTPDDRARGCVIGAPPVLGLEGLRLSPDGSAFVGASTGSTFRVWGAGVDLDDDIETVVDDFRDARRMGLNVVRLLLDTEDYLVAPACATCGPTVDTAAIDHLGDAAVAAEQMGLYLDVTGLGIAYHHHHGSWFDDLDASPEAEIQRWAAQDLFWQAVATKLRPRTSVAWYDLMNEPTMGVPATTWCFKADLPATEPCWNPNVVKSLTDPANPARQRTSLEVARAWTTRMRDAIKVGAGDTVHPVSVGQLPFCAGPLNSASRQIADFDMIHMYPKDATLTADIARVNDCKQPGRPLVVEETFYTASPENLERFLDDTQARTAGYLGHLIGGTPSELTEWLVSHDPAHPEWWPRLIWLVWDQFSMRQVNLRNPTGPGIMPS